MKVPTSKVHDNVEFIALTSDGNGPGRVDSLSWTAVLEGAANLLTYANGSDVDIYEWDDEASAYVITARLKLEMLR